LAVAPVPDPGKDTSHAREGRSWTAGEPASLLNYASDLLKIDKNPCRLACNLFR